MENDTWDSSSSLAFGLLKPQISFCGYRCNHLTSVVICNYVQISKVNKKVDYEETQEVDI